MDYSKKRPIDIKSISANAEKTLRKFIKGRSDSDVIDFARASGVRVGRWESQQKTKAYSFLAEIFNAQIEQDREKKAEQKKAAKKEQKKIQKERRTKAIETLKTSGFGAAVNKKFLEKKLGVVFDYTTKPWNELSEEEADDRTTAFIKKLSKITPLLKDSFYAQHTYTLEDGTKKIGGSVYSFDKDSKRDYYTKALFIWKEVINGGNEYDNYWNMFYEIHPTEEDPREFYFKSVRLVISTAVDIKPKKLEQYFLDGASHCICTPLKTLFTKMIENSNSKEVVKKYNRTLNKINEFEKIYDKGVPEEDMEMIASTVGYKIIIHDLIGNEYAVYNKNAKRNLHLTNNRKNHVEPGYITISNDYKPATQKEIYDMVLADPKCIISGDWKNPRAVQTEHGAYAVFNDEYDLFKEFSDKIGIRNYAINAVKYQKLNEFLKEARLINSAPVPLNNNPNDVDHDIIHIDIEKAYTQHKKCEYYQGFLGKIHHFVRGDFSIDFIKSHVGIYKFTVYSCTHKLLGLLGIKENTDYTLPSPEILKFVSMGCSIGIHAGAFGSTFDFDYTPEMLENRNYCTWAGKLGSDKKNNEYMFKADREWASHLKHELGDANVNFYEKDGFVRISIRKKSYTTTHHILAFITSYTRINMLTLMESVRGELQKVILDGIYYRGNIVNDSPIPFKEKEVKKHTGFTSGWYFRSEVDISNIVMFKKEFDGNCILAGAGGTGKTHSVFNYEGFLDVLYVVPTNQLGIKQKVQYTTIHRLIGEDCQAYNTMYRTPSVILIDELTMIDKGWIEKAIKMYPESLMLIAGDIDKNQWYQTRNGRPGKFSEIWRPTDWRYVFYETDYRAKCETLKRLKYNVRNEMKKVFTNGGHIDTMMMNYFISSVVPTYTFEDGVRMFNDGDIWICGTHKTEEKLKDAGVLSTFEDTKKTSFTIHSFQGLTIPNQRVFISLDLFEYAMLYTAISRVCHFSQLVFIK